MYINPFFAGILVGVVVTVLGFIIAAVIYSKGGRGKNE